MATTMTVMLCPHCRSVLEGKPDVCPLCSGTITDAQKQPECETVSIQTPKPTPQAVSQIQAASPKGIPPSGAEIRHGFATMLVMVGIGVAAFFFGRWVTENFRGPGILFFGLLPMIASPVLVVLGIGIFLHTMCTDRRGKTPAKAFEKIWISGYFSSFSLWNAKKAMGKRVLRSLPRTTQIPSPEDLQEYCEKMQQFVTADLDVLEGRLPAKGKWKDGSGFPIKDWGIRELSPTLDTKCIQANHLGNGLWEVRGEVCFRRTRQHSVSDQKQYELERARLKLAIVSYCVQNGKHYYMTDVTPPLPPLLDGMPAPALEESPAPGREPAKAWPAKRH